MTKRKIPTAYRSQRRRARGENKPGFQLQPRDLDIMQAVYLNRVLTLPLLLIRFPPDPERTPPHVQTKRPTVAGTNLYRRLAKLFHHSYLDRTRLRRSYFDPTRTRQPLAGGDLIYALADAGAAILKTHRPQLNLTASKWSERNRTLTDQYIEHALMVARVCLSLAAAIEKAGTLTLGSFQRDSHKKDQKLAAKWTRDRKKIVLVPDALFTLIDPTRPAGKNRLAFFLEADRSTMTLDRMAEKYRRYAELFDQPDLLLKQYGVTTAKVLTVTKSEQRAQNLAALIADNGAPVRTVNKKLFFTTSETTYTAHPANFLATTWQRGDDPGHRVGVIPSPLAVER